MMWLEVKFVESIEFLTSKWMLQYVSQIADNSASGIVLKNHFHIL